MTPPAHPSFEQPSDPSVLVWRYRDLPKLLSLILRNELYLARLDRLPDKFEGTLPRTMSEAVRHQLAALKPDMDPKQVENQIALLQEGARRIRRVLYVNCWHIAAYESEAMWRIYSGSDAGIAINLPYARLRDSIDAQMAYLGIVKYIEFECELFSVGNAFNAAMHKRREIEYEREARIVHLNVPIERNMEGGGPPAVTLPWSPTLIEKIVISPYASIWYAETVRETIHRIAPDLANKVALSVCQLTRDPLA
jgi:hypothetical protein